MATSVSPPLHLPLVTSRTQSRSRSACNVQSTFLSSTSDRFYQVRRPVLKLDRIRSKVSASSTQVLEKPSSTTISRASDVNLGDPSYPFGFGAFDQQDLLPRNPSWLAYAIKSSCENKPEVLSLNESNCQMMANLNLSHTFSQVIQEDMSQGVGLIDKSLVTRTGDILQNTELPTALPGSMTKDTSEPFIVVMAVPKKRTSRTKSKIRKNVWKAKGKVAAKKALSLAKSIATGRSKSFVVSK